jgi:Uma2 family endonuclease
LELVNGRLKAARFLPWKHGVVAGNLHTRLADVVESSRAGLVLASGTGFLLRRTPDTVRAPSISFVHVDWTSERLPESCFWPGSPDLAVEVVSPNDRSGEIDEKVMAWLDSGASMVWVVNPAWQTVTVYRSATQITMLTENDDLSGEDVIEGFSCRVGDIFAQLAGPAPE